MNPGQILMLFLFVLEVGFLTFLRGKAGNYVSPVIFFTISLLIGLIPLIKKPVFLFKTRLLREIRQPAEKYRIITVVFVFLSGAIIAIIWLNHIFRGFVPDYHVSDVIPTIQLLSKRLLEGTYPYLPITEFGSFLYPTYLPMQWLPYTVAEFLKTDYRWVTFSIWFLSMGYYYYHLVKYPLPYLQTLILAALPYLALFLLIAYNRSAFENTVELMVSGYYLFLAFTLRYKSVFARGIGLTMTLLSRFSLVLWLPLYFMVGFFRISKKRTMALAAVVFLLVLIIYGIPFLSKNHSIFQNGMTAYSRATVGEWRPKSFQAPDDPPFHLYFGVGAACYFYKYVPGSLEHKIDLLHKTDIILSLLVVLVLGVYYFKSRIKPDFTVFSICSLKISLTFFYTFIQIPYTYLFFVPIFLSIAVIFEYCLKAETNKYSSVYQ